MRPYTAILSARFRTLLQYRAAAFAGFVTQLFWGLIRVMIFDAFYRSSTARQPMTYADTVTYVWLGQATLAMFPWNVDADIRAMIRTGSVAYELLRPVDLYAMWYSRIVALRTAPMLLRAVPMFVVAIPFLGMRLPPNVACACWFALSMIGAVMLSAAITALLSISLLWTISGEGIARLVPALVVLCSGLIVPLPLFPGWAQTLLAFLPFRGVADAPFRVYMGSIPPDHAVWVFVHQIAWTAALVWVGRMAVARASRRLVVQGG